MVAIWLWMLLALTQGPAPGAGQACLVDATARLTTPASENLGSSVAIDGDVVVAGSWADDEGSVFDAGSASVYRRNGRIWSLEKRFRALDGMQNDRFGRAVAVSGDVILVGAELGDGTVPSSDTGSVYVYRFDGSTWSEEAQLAAADADYNDGFGIAVAVDGDVALVGAPRVSGDGFATGAAYVFRYDGSVWIQEARLTAAAPMSGDAFGTAVALDGDLAVIGAGTPFSTGGVYVYRFDGSAWSEEAQLTAAADYDDGFGAAVAVDGDRVVVGTPGEDDDSIPILDRGAAYVYRFDGLAWIEEQKLVASDATGSDFGQLLGYSVALEGDWLAAGAFSGNGGSGAIYAYHRHPEIAEPWFEEGQLVNLGDPINSELGASVAIDGTTVVAGAPNTFQLVDGFFDYGAAFVFEPLEDCSSDGILDSCQDDCNFNRIRDVCEIAAGTVDDDNLNGVPDVCECGCIDLFFLIDNTATMGDSIATIQAELPQLVELARVRAVNGLRLGMIRFGDRVDVMHDLTSDVEAVLASLMNIGGTVGGSLPEPSDAALQELFEKDVECECLEDAEHLDPAIDFRPACLNVAVLLTDALPTGCEDGEPSPEDLANAAEQAQNAADAGVQIFAIYPPNPVDFVGGDIHGEPLPTAVQIREIMRNYADVSGGIFAEVEEDATGLLEAVIAGLDRCVDCNGNDVSDFTDVADGTSLDEDGDTRPDECQPGACCVAECNGQGKPEVVLENCLAGKIPLVPSCRETTREICDGLILEDPLVFGTFQGLDSDCATASCGGACCLAERCVTTPDQAFCKARSGTFRGDGTSCDQPGVCAGGCCRDEGAWCEDEVPLDVCKAEYGGVSLGPGVACRHDDNCLGACCRLAVGETACQQTTRWVCEEFFDGHFSGVGSDCEAEDFVGCQGACCETSEACWVTTYEECAQADLMFAGPGTSCGEDRACPDYGGCWIAETCQVTSRVDCVGAGGSYLGAGRDCGENCAPPPGSCLGDVDLDGDVDEDDLRWLNDHEEVWSRCVYGVGDCSCDHLNLCQVQGYDPECARAFIEERLGTSC
jgi:hypothetical protein